MYVCSIFRQHVLGGSHFSASLCQSTGEENASIIWTSDSGGTMQFLSWLRSTGLTLHPLKDTKGWAGVCPTNLCTCALWIWQSHSNEFFKTSCCPEGVLWEYKVFGFFVAILLVPEQSLPELNNKSNTFSVSTGLSEGCSLSPIWLIIFIDRISRGSDGVAVAWFSGIRISSLLFVDGVIQLALN